MAIKSTETKKEKAAANAAEQMKNDSSDTQTIGELKEMIRGLLGKIDELQKAQEALSDEHEALLSKHEDLVNERENAVVLSEPMPRIETINDEVVLVCNLIGTLKAKFPTWTLSMSRFGQRVSITKHQFQELVNNHRKYFDKEYILVDPKYMNIAAELDVPVYNPDSKDVIHPADLKKIGKMSGAQLEEYYLNLSQPMQRMFINYFMGKCYEYDPDYFTVEKMGLLNTLTKSNLFEYLIKLCSSKIAANNADSNK